MDEKNIFYIEQNGHKIKANILTNFEVYGDNYCVYTIPIENNKNNIVYCAKIVNNQLVKIEDEKELRITNKIIHNLLKIEN